MLRIFRDLFITLCVLGTITQQAFAADKWHIGFNDPSIAGYQVSLGRPCVNCPQNVTASLNSYSQIANRLLYLAQPTQGQTAGGHVGVFREIVPLGGIRPSANVNYYNDVIDIVSIYSAYNLQLVLTLGLPVPDWIMANLPTMNVPRNTYFQVMPISDSDWVTLKNLLSWEMGNLIKALWDSPRIDRTWLTTQLFVEGFNEFDSLEDISTGGTPISRHQSSTPSRAADLQNGIQWVLSYYGINVQTTMPSIVGVYPSLTMSQYIDSYYNTYNGSGLPNVHIYADTSLGNWNYKEQFFGTLSGVQAAVARRATSLAWQIIVSETGAAGRVNTYCTSSDLGSLDWWNRNLLYADIASDPRAANISTLIFWRLSSLPDNSSLRCEAHYGIMDLGGNFTPTGNNVFYYLNQP